MTCQHPCLLIDSLLAVQAPSQDLLQAELALRLVALQLITNTIAAAATSGSPQSTAWHLACDQSRTSLERGQAVMAIGNMRAPGAVHACTARSCAPAAAV